MSSKTYSILIIALAAAGFSGQGIAQMGHNHGGPAAMQAQAGTSMAMEEGTVKKIDKANGKVALAHSAQKDGMPAMTMVYGVKDPAWLDKMQVGQKVRFAVDPAKGGTTVTQFELVK